MRGERTVRGQQMPGGSTRTVNCKKTHPGIELQLQYYEVVRIKSMIGCVKSREKQVKYIMDNLPYTYCQSLPVIVQVTLVRVKLVRVTDNPYTETRTRTRTRVYVNVALFLVVRYVMNDVTFVAPCTHQILATPLSALRKLIEL